MLGFKRPVVFHSNALAQLHHELVKLFHLLRPAESLAKNQVDVSIFGVAYDVAVIITKFLEHCLDVANKLRQRDRTGTVMNGALFIFHFDISRAPQFSIRTKNLAFLYLQTYRLCVHRSVAAIGRCRVCVTRRAQHCQVAIGRARLVVRFLVVAVEFAR